MKEKNSFKFRAWHKLNKIMLDVIAINFSLMQITADIETRKIYPELDYWWKETDIPFSEIVLMQSTGLKDKNSAEIFEGDIIIDHYLLNNMNGAYFAVVKNYNYFYLKMIRNGEICNNIINPMMFDKHAYLNGVEVVGNIYENPELIEVECN